MDDAEWSGPIARTYNQRKRKLSDHSNEEQNDELDCFEGEEAFMKAVHPFEVSSKHINKKASPMQRAIIYCIQQSGGKATEKEILQFITEKWDIINKYSERGFLVEPNIRVIRLNCAVKKKGKHLFIQSPDNPETWMLNSITRRSRKSKNRVVNEIEEKTEKIILKEISETVEKETDIYDNFEECILNLLEKQGLTLTFEEICENVEKFERLPGLFNRLPFKRRVRACLMKFKCQRRVFSDNHSICWSTSIIPENYSIVTQNFEAD